MSLIRGLLARLGPERGQVLIFFVGIFTIIALIAAITIDFGLWFSERRGAQKDADLVSLAGAYELLDESGTAADAEAAVQDYAAANDLDPPTDLHNVAVRSLDFPDGFDGDPEYCHTAPDSGGRLNAVVLDVDHDTTALFADVYQGLGGAALTGAPDVGAHACARAGSLLSTTGLRPWTVPMFTSECFDWQDDGDGVKEADDDKFIPQFLQDCVFRIDEPSQVGSIRLGDEEGEPCNEPGGGAAKYQENIIEGADAWCSIGQLIDTEPGLNQGPTLTALAQLLSTEGECDAQNGSPPNGIDGFDESFEATSDVPGPKVTFTPKDCSTPRAINIVILDEFDGIGFDTRPIEGFAAFFLQQCETLDRDGNIIDIFPKCDMRSTSYQVRGFFMSVLKLEGDIGDFDEFGTKVIRLVE